MPADPYRVTIPGSRKFVSERIGINDVESAFEKMANGQVLRSVVEL